MPGLNLRAAAGGNVAARATAQARYGSVADPTTATEAAYGPQLRPNGGGLGGLAPTGGTGLAFWVGIAGAALLLGVYLSLPG